MSSSRASFSITSIVAIIAAILSFKFGAILGLVMAAVAFIFGTLGIVLALSPKTRGGGLSILAVILSFAGAIAAVIKAVMSLF